MRDKRRETRIERGRGEGEAREGWGSERGGGVITDKSKRENEKKILTILVYGRKLSESER